MISIQLPLSDEMESFIKARMAADGHESAAEYVQSLIREDQKRRARQALEAKLLEGLQGPAVEMTGEEWDSIMREAAERLAREQARA